MNIYEKNLTVQELWGYIAIIIIINTILIINKDNINTVLINKDNINTVLINKDNINTVLIN